MPQPWRTSERATGTFQEFVLEFGPLPYCLVTVKTAYTSQIRLLNQLILLLGAGIKGWHCWQSWQTDSSSCFGTSCCGLRDDKVNALPWLSSCFPWSGSARHPGKNNFQMWDGEDPASEWLWGLHGHNCCWLWVWWAAIAPLFLLLTFFLIFQQYYSVPPFLWLHLFSSSSLSLIPSLVYTTNTHLELCPSKNSPIQFSRLW